MTIHFTTPPESICILRLSSIGDVCHALPTVSAVQEKWPSAKIAWIIGAIEYELLKGMPGIEFITFNKKAGIKELLNLRKKLKNLHFDILLLLQTSLRANVAALSVDARIRLGFDKARSKELHNISINQVIDGGERQHQVDDFFDFARTLGIRESSKKWHIELSDKDNDYAKRHIKTGQPTIVINAVSSPSKRVHRNWPKERFVEVISSLARHNVDMILIGGTTAHEREVAEYIAANSPCAITNLAGKTTLKQVAAVLKHATLLLTSDSGPAHIATAVHTPVVALHAATNPQQTGPYLDLDKVINKYPQAVIAEYKKSVKDLAWGIRAHGDHIMDMITSEEVVEKILQVLDMKSEA